MRSRHKYDMRLTQHCCRPRYLYSAAAKTSRRRVARAPRTARSRHHAAYGSRAPVGQLHALSRRAERARARCYRCSETMTSRGRPGAAGDNVSNMLNFPMLYMQLVFNIPNSNSNCTNKSTFWNQENPLFCFASYITMKDSCYIDNTSLNWIYTYALIPKR